MTTEEIFCSLKSNCNHKMLITEFTSKLIQRLSSYNQRNKLTNWVTVFWNFTYNIHCFFCYGIESADRQPVIRNPLRIKIDLSQIMTFSIKREKVCAVCPYLLLIVVYVFFYFKNTLFSLKLAILIMYKAKLYIYTVYSIGSKSSAYRKSIVVARDIWKQMNVAKKTIAVVSTTENYQCSQAVIGQLCIVSYRWLDNSIMSTIIKMLPISQRYRHLRCILFSVFYPLL